MSRVAIETAYMVRDEAVREWCRAMGKADPLIQRKIAAYLERGEFADEMPTKLIQAHERLLDLQRDPGDGGL